jgi:D-glycerate 3-kinase
MPPMNRESFYALLWSWIAGVIRDTAMPRPVLVGLSAPQGAGKTTLTERLCRIAADDGLRGVSLSIDDFYLTHQAQLDLARHHPDNPYLQQRGYPGTHDVDLGLQVLNAIRNIGEHGTVSLPSYDRSAFGGLGDRRPSGEWPVARAPLDFAILEGWMLGFAPVPPDTLPDQHLRLINEYLRAYAPWHASLDAFVWLEPEDPRFMLDWRVEAEENARAAGRGGMTTEQVTAFAAQFLPAYLTYLPGLAARPPITGPMLTVAIGRDRLPKAL